MATVVNKLVRDKVPDLIRSDGKTPNVEILQSDIDYVDQLMNKLEEEVAEVRATKNKTDLLRELADVAEVSRALAVVHGLSATAIEQVRITRHFERGGFAKRIFLESVG